VEVKAPRILSRMEYRALRDAARDDTRTFAIIEILLQTGITISELANIKMQDIDISKEPGSLHIPRQHSKESRTIPLNKAAIEAIRKYTENERPKIDGAEHLFITKSGKPLLVRNIRSTIERYYKAAGVENAKVNDLRHTLSHITWLREQVFCKFPRSPDIRGSLQPRDIFNISINKDLKKRPIWVFYKKFPY
jgi:site-specific recombinase XerD